MSLAEWRRQTDIILTGAFPLTKYVARSMIERGVAGRWGRPSRSPAALTLQMEPFRRGIPMQRLPKPTDYGLAAVFLVSDDAAMITGADLRVDAGAVARYWAWDPAQATAGG